MGPSPTWPSVSDDVMLIWESNLAYCLLSCELTFDVMSIGVVAQGETFFTVGVVISHTTQCGSTGRDPRWIMVHGSCPPLIPNAHNLMTSLGAFTV